MSTAQEIYQKSLELFKEINQIPRCSKHEEKIRAWIKEKAQEYDLNFKEDEAGNIIIYIPATVSKESTYDYVLQGHMDMVCNKKDDSRHDFSKDSIQTYIEDDWLKAKETTLGADNGIAIAIMLAIANSKVKHTGLELLFTVDEETGLTGASKLEDNALRGKYLINIDSEDEGVITIGCAGNIDAKIEKKYASNSINNAGLKVIINGGKGGHSGVDIHQKIANTNILMARLLKAISNKTTVQLSTITGGIAHNAIPTKTEASFCVEDISQAKQIINEFSRVIGFEYKTSDPNLKITTEDIYINDALNAEDTVEVINTMLLVPHGILSMSNDVEGLVETSNNFAVAKLNHGKLYLESMARSSINTQRDYVVTILQSLSQMIKAKFKVSAFSSAWEPDTSSSLLKRAIEKYIKLNKKEPIVEAIHAGLECAVIGEKHKGMEMISIGPTIKGAHTPEERLYLPSVKTTIEWILEIINTE